MTPAIRLHGIMGIGIIAARPRPRRPICMDVLPWADRAWAQAAGLR